jgi:hypothetical protein
VIHPAADWITSGSAIRVVPFHILMHPMPRAAIGEDETGDGGV